MTGWDGHNSVPPCPPQRWHDPSTRTPQTKRTHNSSAGHLCTPATGVEAWVLKKRLAPLTTETPGAGVCRDTGAAVVQPAGQQ